MEAEVEKSIKWVVLVAIVGLVLLTFYVMVTWARWMLISVESG